MKLCAKIICGAGLLAALLPSAVHAACGDKVTINGSVITVPAVVSWDANLEQSLQVAQIKKKPFAIYFVCKDDAKVVGENTDVIKEFMTANNNSLPSSVVEVPRIVGQLRDLGVGTFVKIPLTKEHRALAEKYAGEINSLIVCTPTGEKLSVIKCTPDATKDIEAAKKELAAWQAKK